MIVRAYEGKQPRFGARVFDFPWCDDFAAARNETLRHATGQWVLWLDADEYFDEANRGNIPRALASPSAKAAARYYQALIRVCRGCTVGGLDVPDQNNISPTLRYGCALAAAESRVV